MECLRVVSGDESLFALRLLAMSALASPRVILIDKYQAGRARWRHQLRAQGFPPLSVLVGVVVRISSLLIRQA
jgi:hypothetical protein